MTISGEFKYRLKEPEWNAVGVQQNKSQQRYCSVSSLQ